MDIVGHKFEWGKPRNLLFYSRNEFVITSIESKNYFGKEKSENN